MEDGLLVPDSEVCSEDCWLEGALVSTSELSASDPLVSELLASEES